ncbi:MAG: ABC transporter permease [Acidimicrobiales bacterium]
MSQDTGGDVTPGGIARWRAANRPKVDVSHLLRGTRKNVVGLLAALVVLYIFFGIKAPNFLTVSNQLSIALNTSFLAIPAWAMTLVIGCAEIDMSTGPAVAFAGVLLGVLVTNYGLPLFLGILIVLAVGGILGGAIGWARAYLNVPTFVGSLALYLGFRSLAELFSNAIPISLSSQFLGDVGTGSVLGFPNPAWIAIVLFFVFLVVIRKTPFGRSVLAIGGNPDSARVAGIPVGRRKVAVMAISGAAAALTGIILAGQLASGNSEVEQVLTFQVIAAVIIGGTALFGGRASMLGTLVGVVFIETITDGLILLGVNTYADGVVTGLLIFAAVTIGAGELRLRRRAHHGRDRGVRKGEPVLGASTDVDYLEPNLSTTGNVLRVSESDEGRIS